MEQIPLYKSLNESSLFADLPAGVLDELAAVSVVLRFPANTVLFREGSENHNLYVIQSGQVVLEMCVPARGCTRLISLGPGDLVAWSALLGSGRMTASAIASEDTEVIAISAHKLLKICEANHEIGYHVMRRIAMAVSLRLLATRLQMLDLYSTESPVIPS